MTRIKRSWAVAATALGGCTLFSHCTTMVEDAVLQGVSIVITETTVQLLRLPLLPLGLGGGGFGGGNHSGNGDPFGENPVQT